MSRKRNSKYRDDLLGYLFVGLFIIGAFFVLGGPYLIQYSLANDATRCELRLNQDNPDEFCDSNNKINSFKELKQKQILKAEELRLSELSPYERCREEESNRINYEDLGDVVITCNEDGTRSYNSIDELRYER